MSETGSEVELVRLSRSKTTPRIHYKLEHSVAAALEESSLFRDDISTISSTALGSVTTVLSDVTKTETQADGDSEVTEGENGQKVGVEGEFIIVKKKRGERSGRRKDKDGKRRHKHHHHHHGHHHHHHNHQHDKNSKVTEEEEDNPVIEVERMSDIVESPVKEDGGKKAEVADPEADDATSKEESDQETIKGEDDVDVPPSMKVITVPVEDDDVMSPEEIEKRLRIEQLLRREDEVKQRFLLLERRESEIAETEDKLKERENVYVRRSEEVDELNKEIFAMQETLEEEKRSLMHLKADDYRIMEVTMKKAIAEMNRVKDNCKNHTDDIADLQFKVKDLEDEIDLRDKTILNLTERLGITTTEMHRQEYEKDVPNGYAESQSDLESSYAASDRGYTRGHATEASRRILPRSSNEFTRPQSVKISSRPTSARSGSFRRMSSLRSATPNEFNRTGSIKRYTGKMSETVSEYSEPGASNKLDSSLHGSARDLAARRMRPHSARSPSVPAAGARQPEVQGSKACIVM